MGAGNWRTVATVVAALGMVVTVGCAARRGGESTEQADHGSTATLRDDQGRDYVVRTIPKQQASRLDATHVRTNWGITLDLVGEDEATWHYKLYDVSKIVSAPAATPPAADRKAVLASYAVKVRTSDRVQFAPFGAGLPAQGQWRDGFALADVDGDGTIDLVHGPTRAGRGVPHIFLGDGHGAWRQWSAAKYPPLPFDYGDAAAADLDGDGQVDLVLSSHLSGFAALRGDGRGGFTDMGRGLELVKPGKGGPVPFSSRAFELVDWNRDGRLDILALGEGPRLDMARGGNAGGGQRAMAGAAMGPALFLNEGAKGWRRAPDTDPKTAFGQSIVVGDFDADGIRDFATASGTLGRTDIVNLGTRDGGWKAIPVSALRPSAYVRAVAAADFDGDGRDDLAVGYLSFELETWRSGVDVLLSRPGNAFERRPLFAVEDKIGIFALATGDLDGNKTPDLVALNGDGESLVFLGDGHGAFAREKTPPAPWAGRCRGVHVVLRDLDRDGRDDVVAAFAEEHSTQTEDERCPNGGGLMAWKSLPR